MLNRFSKSWKAFISRFSKNKKGNEKKKKIVFGKKKRKKNLNAEVKEKKVYFWDVPQASQNLDKEVSNRITVFVIATFVCFLAIFVRLVFLQVLSYETYVQKKDDYTSIIQYVSAPRGQIFDRNGNAIAKTVVSHNIIFTSPNNMTTEDYVLYANRIVDVFGLDEDKLTERDIKEAYMTYTTLLDRDDEYYNCNDLLTAKERADYANGVWGDMSESTRYGLIYKRIDDDVLDRMSKSEMKMCVVYTRMRANYSSGQENVVIEDVDNEDVTYLVEHKTEFPGFDIDFGGWKREYPYGESLSDVIGTCSTSTEGLPAENKDYYLQRGYQLNAPVGKSGLELQYNEILSGTPEKSRITYNSNGLAEKTILVEAVKGNDVYLSIDMDVQVHLDEVVKEVLIKNAGTEKRDKFSTMFMNMCDPYTGEIIAMSGYQYEIDDPDTEENELEKENGKLKTQSERKLTYFASGNYVSLVNPGSCIKGVTVYMGLSEGVMQPGEEINDTILKIGGEEFGSFHQHGMVDDEKALEVSSNVYMFYVAMRMANATYVEGEQLQVENVQGTLDHMRKYYSMFGLGSKTELDVPNESDGYLGQGNTAIMLLNYAIGQMDMYTPVQLLQYVSMIANGGDMYQLHLMNYITEVNSEQIIDLKAKTLRSQLPTENKEYIQRIQNGFRRVVTTANAFNDLFFYYVPVSGKTGTAEVGKWTTANFVGYAPSQNPEVAFACSAPTSSINDASVANNICAEQVVARALDGYFDKYVYEGPLNDWDLSLVEEE
ncbi:MAG: penicillin-binding protein 2 [Bacillota bacterium]|nr:penicillin-binding protein 2 [Bacillota bacterium]